MGQRAGTIRIAGLLGGLALLIAGCGSSNTSTSTSTSTTTTTAQTSSSTSTTTPATTTSAASGLGLLNSPNCRELLGLSQSFAQAMAGNTTDLQKTAELVKNFADKAPSAIRPDFDVLAADYAKVASALGGYKLNSGQAPSAAVMAKLVTLSSQLDIKKLTQASQDITAWAHTNCGATGG